MSSAASLPFGFVGLGNMGAPMAANIAKGGFELLVYDQAGSAERAPTGTTPVDSLAKVTAAAKTIFLSVPDGKASLSVARDLIALDANKRVTTTVIDLSTTGVAAAAEVQQTLALAESGINYIDCPVSGGQAGARAGTITAIWAGSAALLDQHQSVMQAFAGNIFHVGDRAGQGQAAKLLNNFLSATAMAATSEAMLFGLAQGLDMKTMLDVVNASTGQNTATKDKFPNRILTGSFDAGFHTALMHKDVALYLENVRAVGTPDAVSAVVAQLWQQTDQALPGSDFSEIFNYLREQSK